MKKISLTIIAVFALLTTKCLAQQELSSGVHFGIKAGINVANVTVKSSGLSFTPSSLIGATGGFFATIPAGSGFAVQPELQYSMLGFKVTSGGTTGTAHYDYLVIPVLAKYTFETSGFGAYLGPQIGFLLSAKEKSEGQTEDVKDGLKSTDVAGIIGVEYTFPIGFNLSARYQLGLSNIAKDTNGEGSVKNHAITFTIGYRFK